MSDSPVNLDSFLNFNIRFVLAASVIFLVYSNLKSRPSGYLIVVVLLFLYIFTFISGRYYLREGFQQVKEDAKPLCSKEITQSDVVLDPIVRSFYDKSINSVDDYELSMVFEQENDRELTKELRNKLMSQYPMDWTTNPPSSVNFAKGLKEHFQDTSGAEVNTKIYDSVSGKNMTPPDTDSIEKKEREILQKYKPKDTKDLKTYDISDAFELIKKIYDAKGEIPEVVHKKDTNVYEIVGVRRKDEKIVYEDEEASFNPERTEGGEVTVPKGAVDVLESNDPFFDKHIRSRIDKNDYTKFTPGLERMFAPTYPTKDWY